MQHPWEKYTEAFDDNDDSGNALPQMRSCSTATTIAHRRAERAIRQVVFEDDRTITSNPDQHRGDIADDERTVKSCGGNSAYISLQEDYSDDDTIHR